MNAPRPLGLSPRLAAVVQALPLRPDSRVLEIGCGPGAAARAVAARLLVDGGEPLRELPIPRG